MKRTRRMQAGIAFAVLMFTAVDCAAEGDIAPSKIAAAVVEPHIATPGSDELSYSVSLAGSKLVTVMSILDGLSQAGGKHLAIIVHEEVPIGTVQIVASMASKAGFLDYKVFVFDGERRGMAAVPGFKWIEFSTDPEALRGFFD